ncbi:MAG: hypothetical protein SGBAC_012601 [Bacillariaceae sp.]
MPPFDSTMDTYNHNLEPSNNQMSVSIQHSQSNEDDKLPQLSFDGLLQRDADLPSSKLPFVWKLYDMLEGVEKSGDQHTVSWVESGRAFRVHKLDAFVEDIVPIYFKQSKYKSFQRQLNFYGFTRVTSGPNTGAYYHPKFLKGQKTLCLSIRPKASTTSPKRQQKQAKKKNVAPKPQSSSEEHWMPQIQSLLANGAEHAMIQQEQKQQQQQQQDAASARRELAATAMMPPPYFQRQASSSYPMQAPSASMPQAPSQPRRTITNEENNFQDGDPLNIFGNMTFHYVAKK